MALRFVTGGSGAGKSEYIYRQMIEQADADLSARFMMLVPEQYTLQTQKLLTGLHPRRVLMNIDVLSFNRLAYRIFDEVGGRQPVLLEDTGKRMIIRRLLGQLAPEFETFAGNIHRQGFVMQVETLISELLQYHITVDKLREILPSYADKTALYVKLKDIIRIYAAFMDYISARYMTTEEVLEVLCQVIDQSARIGQTCIFMDNFTGFTPVQYQLLRHILRLSESVTITLPLDISMCGSRRSSYELFHLTRETMENLNQLCREEEIDCTGAVNLAAEANVRYCDHPELAFLEHHLFRADQAVYGRTPEHIQVCELRQPSDEALYAAKRIHHLVCDEGYRYNDIAVVTNDVSRYAYPVSQAFEAYDIPCFIDSKRVVMENMLIEWIRALNEMIAKNFSYTAVFRYMRSGLSGFEPEDIDILENYVLAMGIRGYSRWQTVWTGTLHGIDEHQLNMVNEMRRSFIEGVAPLREVYTRKDASVKAYIQALWLYMQQMDTEAVILGYSERFEVLGDLSRAAEYRQVYQVTIDLFEKISQILGEEIVSVAEYTEILEAGFMQVKLGIIPPGLDQVTFGDIRRTRLNQVKVLFFLGLNEGVVPSISAGGGLVTDKERDVLLKESGIKLAPTSKENICIERFYIYASMTKPSDGLYLCYSLMDSAGGVLRQSSVLNEIYQMFPKLLEHVVSGEYMLQPDDVQSAHRYLLQGIWDMEENGLLDEQWQRLLGWFVRQPAYETDMKRLKSAAFYQHSDEKLSSAAVNALYGDHPVGSVSFLERYAACAFSHYVMYGLRLRERQLHEIQAPDIGLMFHQAIERFSVRIAHSPYEWRNIPDDIRDQMAGECVDSVVLEYNHALMQDSARAVYLGERMKRMTLRTVWALQQQLKKGDFEPSGYEMRFNTDVNTDAMHIRCGAEKDIYLTGKIDRLDRCEADGRTYLKVIDYKSGNTSFDLAAVYHGLQLQLIVYMDAVCELEKTTRHKPIVIPAGVFYYHLDEPLIAAEDFQDFYSSTWDEAVQLQVLSELKMTGLVLDDEASISHLDRTVMESPKVIPVSYKKDGGYTAYSSVATELQYGDLSYYVRRKVTQLSMDVMNGKIPVKPYKYEKETPCTFCRYHNICGFDEKLPGYAYKYLKKMKREDIWQAMSSGGEKDGM